MEFPGRRDTAVESMLGTHSQYPFDNFLLAIYPPVEVASRIYGVADGVRRERGLTGVCVQRTSFTHHALFVAR